MWLKQLLPVSAACWQQILLVLFMAVQLIKFLFELQFYLPLIINVR